MRYLLLLLGLILFVIGCNSPTEPPVDPVAGVWANATYDQQNDCFHVTAWADLAGAGGFLMELTTKGFSRGSFGGEMGDAEFRMSHDFLLPRVWCDHGTPYEVTVTHNGDTGTCEGTLP